MKGLGLDRNAQTPQILWRLWPDEIEVRWVYFRNLSLGIPILVKGTLIVARVLRFGPVRMKKWRRKSDRENAPRFRFVPDRPLDIRITFAKAKETALYQ